MSYILCDFHTQASGLWNSEMKYRHFSVVVSETTQSGMIFGHFDDVKILIDQFKVYDLETKKCFIINTTDMLSLLVHDKIAGLISYRNCCYLVYVIDVLAYQLSTLLEFDHYQRNKSKSFTPAIADEYDIRFVPRTFDGDSCINHFFIADGASTLISTPNQAIFLGTYLYYLFKDMPEYSHPAIMNIFEKKGKYYLRIWHFDHSFSYMSEGFNCYKITDKKAFDILRAKIKLSKG